jgi:hypothetical protein
VALFVLIEAREEKDSSTFTHTRADEIRRVIILERSEPHTSEYMQIDLINHKAFASTEASKERDRAGFGLAHHKNFFFFFGHLFSISAVFGVLGTGARHFA